MMANGGPGGQMGVGSSGASGLGSGASPNQNQIPGEVRIGVGALDPGAGYRGA